MIKRILLASFVILSIASCKKEHIPRAQLLANKAWKQTTYTVSPAIYDAGQYITDLYALMEDCEKDDYREFLLPNVYKQNRGQIHCQTYEAQELTGVWYLDATETILTISYNGVTNLNIQYLDENTLIYSYSLVLGSTNYVVTKTWVKQ